MSVAAPKGAQKGLAPHNRSARDSRIHLGASPPIRLLLSARGSRNIAPARPILSAARRERAVLAGAADYSRRDRAAGRIAGAAGGGPAWLVPAFEGVLFIGMFLATPHELEHEHKRRRRTALSLTAFVGAANIYSLGALTHFLLHHGSPNGRELIVSGVLIWMTNFLIFALWYWEMDRGGAGKRAAGHDGPPDLLFPQMSDDHIEPRDWRPKFVDYLYVSLTNATAFSPTDTMPLTPDREDDDGRAVACLAGDNRIDCVARREHPWA